MGPDGIQLRILRELGVCPQCFSQWFLSGLGTPERSQLTETGQIFKKGRKEELGKYRPASLTSVTTKIMDKIILESIEKYLKSNAVTGNSQHSFMRGKSCLLNLRQGS